MKKFGALLLIILLSGCSYSNTKPSADSPTQADTLCTELKRNIIFNTASGPNIGAASATQKAEMLRLYDKYNCGKLDK